MVIDQTMSDFDQTTFQTSTFTELRYLTQAQKVPNALLFHGNHGTRRKEAAFLFSKQLNCLEDNSNPECSCRSCKKIDSGLHPDIHLVSLPSKKKNITIAQIREAGLAISNKPNEATYRMVLICDADTMNVQAQNALLKILEEPPSNTFFILLAQKLSLLLPTIISRCRKIGFKSLSDKMIEQCLVQQHDQDPLLARIASKTAVSNLERAMRYLNIDIKESDIDWVKRRKWILNSLSDLVQTKEKDSFKGLLMSQRLSLDPELIEDSLAVMISFFRDLIVFKFDPENIVNLDFSRTFADINQKVSQGFFFHWLKELYKTEKRLTTNSALRLTLDNFFLQLELSKGKPIYD